MDLVTSTTMKVKGNIPLLLQGIASMPPNAIRYLTDFNFH
jgi:hypothetical protein